MNDRRRGRYLSNPDAYEDGAETGRGANDRSTVARYDRSRYGTRATRVSSEDGYDAEEGREPASRSTYYDSFYDDMRVDDRIHVSADNPRASYSRDRATYTTRRAGSESPHEPKRSGRKGVLIAVCVVAVLVLVGAGAAFAYMNSISASLHEGVDDELLNALVETDMAKEPFYMLLLGTDGSAERDNDIEMGGSYRSDSMMLARIDAPNKKATLVSISRDIVVDLGQYGEQKINAAYGLGGPALSVKAVSKLAGVDISHYAQVDFDAFSALVDALGGVEVDVPVEVDDWEAGGYVPAGPQTLDGASALILCRSRNTYITSAHPDEMRAANQRLVISAIAKKLLDSDILTIANSVQALAHYVTTDLALNDIIGLAQAMQGLDSATDIYTAQAPTISEYVDDTWIENLNQKEWDAMMKRVDEGLPPVEETAVDPETGTVIATAGSAADNLTMAKTSTITVKNGTDIQGVANKTRTLLMESGYSTVIISDAAPGYEYPLTLIVYNNASEAEGAEDIARIMGQGQTFLNDGSYLLSDTDYLVVIGDDYVPSS